MHVRKASTGDAVALARAIRLLHGRSADPSAIEAFLADPYCLTYLAFDSGEPVGCLYGYELRRPEQLQPAFFLYRIDVHEGHRRCGVGRSLLEAFLEEARSRGGCKAWVQAGASDPRAQAFYRACGGTPYGEQDVLFGFEL